MLGSFCDGSHLLPIGFYCCKPDTRITAAAVSINSEPLHLAGRETAVQRVHRRPPVRPSSTTAASYMCARSLPDSTRLDNMTPHLQVHA